ncbi:MAG: sugar ABC transporter substrate-binding protein [Fretibacterium sp.]|nr:sugar ABC transporter substrate-binding protein [Fretibacterium sp.]
MKRIGVLLADVKNPFWQAKKEQYLKAAPSFGFELFFREAADSGDAAAQSHELMRMTEEDYDAVILNPLTDDNLLPALGALPFPAFDVGPKCDPERTRGLKNYFPLVAADFEGQGALVGDALVSEVKDAGEGWALIVGGFCGARQSILRCRGAFKAFQRVFPLERIVTLHADFDRKKAFRAVRELSSRLTLRAVFCANDLMALGAVEALKECESPLATPVPVGGVDAIPEALEALQDGRLFCTVHLPHEELVNGVLRSISSWFQGDFFSTSRMPLARSVLMRRS